MRLHLTFNLKITPKIQNYETNVIIPNNGEVKGAILLSLKL